ncbi:MAG: roadblock/LC7 domain-containing protein [Thermodesulfovibrionales bacterium]
MSFSEILKDVVTKVEGSVGAFIIASDGIPIDAYIQKDNIDQSALSAEFSAILKTMNFALENLQLGNMDEFSVATERYKIILRKITPEYYLILVTEPDGNIGKARFFLKITAPKIQKEI